MIELHIYLSMKWNWINNNFVASPVREKGFPISINNQQNASAVCSGKLEVLLCQKKQLVLINKKYIIKS